MRVVHPSAVRYAAASAVMDGKLWLVGGARPGGIDESVFVYDTAGDSWAVGRAPLPRPLGDCRAAILGTETFLVGLLVGKGRPFRFRNAGWVKAAGAPPVSGVAGESVLLG